MNPSSVLTTPTRKKAINTNFSAASFSTPPRSIEYDVIPPLQVYDAEMINMGVREEDDGDNDDDEEVAGINSPPLLCRRSGVDINIPKLSNPNQLRRISLSPRPRPSCLPSNTAKPASNTK